jgi:beta-lactamase regulating signal transducer with metallopeptidase domain
MFLRLALASFDIFIVALIVFAFIILFRIKSPRIKSLLYLIVLANGIVGLLIGPMIHLGSMEPPSRYGQGYVNSSPPASTFTIAPAFVADSVQVTTPSTAYVFNANGNVYRDIMAWQWLMVPWAFCVFILTVRKVIALRSLRRIVRKGLKADVDLRARVLYLSSKMGIRRPPKTIVSNKVDSPALMGVFRPKIVLPEWMVIEDIHDTKQLDWAIQHELMHYRMRDHLANAVRTVAMVLFFFHPVVRWASKRWELEAEQACDDALVHTPFEAKAYASQLYHLLVRMQLRRVDTVIPALYASRTQVKRRVEKLLADARWRRRRPGWKSKIAVAAFAMVILLNVARIEGATNHRSAWHVTGNHVLDLRNVLTSYIGDEFGGYTLQAHGQFGFFEAYGLPTSISGGSFLRLIERSPGQHKTLRITSGPGNVSVYRYRVNGQLTEFDAEGKSWAAPLINRLFHKKMNNGFQFKPALPYLTLNPLQPLPPLESGGVIVVDPINPPPATTGEAIFVNALRELKPVQ